MTTKDEVGAYLGGVRALIESGRVLFVSRPKNEEALLALEMSKKAAVEDVRCLTPENYCGGPQEDRDRPEQECWMFGLNIKSQDIYVKLVIDAPAGRKRLKILSFHQAERTLCYQF